jgi:GNAT superfamily N-acetyltransferase
LKARWPVVDVLHRNIRMGIGITIREYRSEHQFYFEKFNRQWIGEFFEIEPVDKEVLENPEEHIISHGGLVLVAYFDDLVAGTVALKYVRPQVYEFTKMAVDVPFRGKKIGRVLSMAAIEKAREMNAKSIILYSNTVLTAAISLYRSLGFVEVPLDGPYKRSNIKMELVL